VENEIGYVRLFDKYEEGFVDFKIGELQTSAWKDYPKKYKFIGAQIFLD
jgi:hypothetical protein